MLTNGERGRACVEPLMPAAARGDLRHGARPRAGARSGTGGVGRRGRGARRRTAEGHGDATGVATRAGRRAQGGGSAGGHAARRASRSRASTAPGRRLPGRGPRGAGVRRNRGVRVSLLRGAVPGTPEVAMDVVGRSRCGARTWAVLAGAAWVATACGCVASESERRQAMEATRTRAPAVAARRMTIEAVGARPLDVWPVHEDVGEPRRGASAKVAGRLRREGVEVEVRRTGDRTVEDAVAARFVSSPTIRVDGRDVAFSSARARAATAATCAARA